VSDPLESTEAELEALEREPRRPPKKKLKRAAKADKPRDELGRFTKIEPPKKRKRSK
jgi:hypothetical protein